jgi:RNA recognition motif-containing protein
LLPGTADIAPEDVPINPYSCRIARHQSGQPDWSALKGETMIIYVGNLALETTADELRREFIEFGEVLSVSVTNDSYIGSGQPRGYGYVEMASKAEGTAAIARLEGKKLRNRVISIVEALPLSDKPGTGSPKIGANNRTNKRNKKRERKYQMI